jgi:hypothetical protein
MVLKVMMAYGDNISEEEQWVKQHQQKTFIL